MGQLDRLDDAIATASAQLDSYLAEFGMAVVGGQIVAQKPGMVTIGYEYELHVAVVLKHLEQLRKLEKTRAEIAASVPRGDDHSDVDRWLGSVAGETGRDADD